MKLDLYPHQQEALRKLSNGKILWGGVGSGKSRVAAAYYVKNEAPKQVVVITTAKKRDSKDWETEFLEFGVFPGESVPGMGTLIVDSWNNLHKYTPVAGQFFIFDEQRLVGSGQWTKAFLKIAKQNHWILLSATPGDTWMDYIPVFVANGFYKNRTEFKREHVIFKPYMSYPVVDRYIGVQRLVKYRSQILVRMPYYKETVRHPVKETVEYDKELYKTVWEDRWNPFTEEPIANIGVVFQVLRRVVNSDGSRLKKLEELLEKKDKLILFYNFNYELDMIRDFQGEQGLGYAEWNGHKHEPIPHEAERWLYVVQYAAGAEGWNCTETDSEAFWSLPYSYKLWEQSHGRIDRLDTPFVDLYFHHMRSGSPIDQAIWRSLKAKKSFQTAHYDMTNTQFAEKRLQK